MTPSQYLKLTPRILFPFAPPPPPSSSPFFLITSSSTKKSMATTTSNGSDSSSSSYTTIKERVTYEREIKRSKFIAVAGSISDESSAHSFLSQVKDPRASHNCWAYKVGDTYRSNDDGEPSGTAGKPIYSAIATSGINRVMVVVIRYFGGIKLGAGGLVRAYGGVASECLKNATTCLVKSKVSISMEIPFDLLGVVYHQEREMELIAMKEIFDNLVGRSMSLYKVAANESYQIGMANIGMDTHVIQHSSLLHPRDTKKENYIMLFFDASFDYDSRIAVGARVALKFYGIVIGSYDRWSQSIFLQILV